MKSIKLRFFFFFVVMLGMFFLGAGCMTKAVSAPQTKDAEVKVYNANGEVVETLNTPKRSK